MTNLASSSWPELVPPDVVLIPLGSTEQHGPHLPFDTDTAIAVAVTKAVAAAFSQASVSVVVAPEISIGASGEHQGFPGTVSIGQDALRSVVIEVARSIKTWAPRVIFVNGHGGNVSTLVSAVAQLTDEDHQVMWVACGVAGQDAHAGREETSMMLHIAPENVRLDKAEVGVTESLTTLLPQLREDGVRAVSPNGVLGDPTGASAREGAELLESIAGSVVDHIRNTWPELSTNDPTTSQS